MTALNAIQHKFNTITRTLNWQMWQQISFMLHFISADKLQHMRTRFMPQMHRYLKIYVHRTQTGPKEAARSANI